jgi:uncharacterized protein YtpQ (UPF0354 family)
VANWIDAIASRSGPLKDAATPFAAKHGLERDPRSGPGGVSALCALYEILGTASIDSDEEERSFVEGAGAYFGLVLLSHFPDSAHQSRDGMHRLRLGKHGSFDPFASIARVLEASHVRRALFAEVARAEAEAEGRGPIARVFEETERQLAAFGDVHVAERFDTKLWADVNGARVELDLGRIVEVTRGEDEATLQGAVRRLCNALAPGAQAAEPWSAVHDRLFPRLVGPSFVDALPDPKSLHLLRLAREVWVTLVLRYEGRARYVRQDEVETWSKDGALPRAQALQNLAGTYGRARFSRHDTHEGPLVIAESRDGFDASRLLLPGVHALLREELGTPCVIGIPHRDTLLAAPLGNRALVSTLQARVEDAARRAPHAISRTLLVIDERGIAGELRDDGVHMFDPPARPSQLL